MAVGIEDQRTAGLALAAATNRLRAGGSPTPRLDAELLVAYAAGRDRTWLLAHPEAILTTDAAAALEDWVARRATGEPIAYIRGSKEWLSLRIRTDARALIPRPETELLAEAAIAEVATRLARDDAEIVAWDLGTGSGALAIAIALRFRVALGLGRMRLIASDASPDALALCAENLAAHEVDALVTPACTDLLEAAGASLPRPDIVAANLPYVATAEVDEAAGSLAHEPRLALDGGADGLDLIRRLFAGIGERLAPRGTVLLEVGAGQAGAVRSLAPAGASVHVQADLAGIERLVRIDFCADA